MTLIDLLLAPNGVDGLQARRLQFALRAGRWCWPPERSLRRRAEELAGAVPESPPGSVLLVSVKGNGSAASLWTSRELSGDAGRDHHLLPFRGEALKTLDRAQRLAARDLPLLIDGAAMLRSVNWGAELVWQGSPEAPDTYLDGPSYGASLVIAAASRVLGHAAPADLAASAVLGDDGVLEGVCHLEAKLQVVSSWAPGVRRFLVAAPQLEEASAANARLPADRRLEIVGCNDTRAMLELAFPDLEREAPRAWDDPVHAVEAASHLFRLCLLGDSPVLGWDRVARSAERLLERLRAFAPADSPEVRRTELAHAIARRHADLKALVPWIEDHELAPFPVVVRQMIVAHVLQSATDDGADLLATYLDRAMARLTRPVTEDHPGDLRLRGAIGRALARIRRYREATEWLEAAVQGWFDLFRAHEASIPLCELARVRGLLGERDAVRQLEQRAARIAAEPDCTFVSRAYLQLAVARALVQVGAAGDALGLLEPATFDLTRPHVKEGALRWRARAFDALGDRGSAANARAELKRLSPGGNQHLLAVLDALRLAPGRTDAELDTAVSAIHAKDPTKMRLALEGATDSTERARRFAEEYPY